MLASGRLGLDKARIVDEEIDGQFLVLDTRNGSYFNLEGSSAEVWRCIRNGTDLVGIVDALGQRYSAARNELEAGVEPFLDKLLAEDLIVLEASEVQDAERPSNASPGGVEPFVAPILNLYTDMQELLALDFIGDVDEGGWPRPATAKE